MNSYVDFFLSIRNSKVFIGIVIAVIIDVMTGGSGIDKLINSDNEDSID
tara:strand:- start:311 stop:457 length:147 start_codon:yes stop_codon:yes gene_type:complete